MSLTDDELSAGEEEDHILFSSTNSDRHSNRTVNYTASIGEDAMAGAEGTAIPRPRSINDFGYAKGDTSNMMFGGIDMDM